MFSNYSYHNAIYSINRLCLFFCLFFIQNIEVGGIQTSTTAGELRFTDVINKEEGLSSNYTSTIIQDQHGFIWIGTQDGLNRFDGYQVIQYKHDPNNKNSLSNNDIISLLEDKKGNIWIGTYSRGLNKYDPQTDSFTSFDYQTDKQQSTQHGRINDLAEDQNQHIWVATEKGLSRYNTDTKQFSHYPLKHISHIPLAVNTVTITSSNLVLAGTAKGLFVLNPDKKTTQYYEHDESLMTNTMRNRILDIMEDDQHNIWILNGNGLEQWNPMSGKFTPKIHEALISLGAQYSLKFTHGNNGEIWIASIKGLFSSDSKTNSFTHYFHDKNNPESLPDPTISSVLIDKTHNLWIAMSTMGVVKVNLQARQFERLTHKAGNKTSLSYNDIESITEDDEGFIWVVSLEGTVYKLDRHNRVIARYKTDTFTSSYHQYSIPGFITKAKNNQLWIGTIYDGLKKFDPQTESITHYFHKPKKITATHQSSVRNCFLDNQDRLWIPLLKSLVVMDTHTEETMDYAYVEKSIPGFPADTVINKITQDQSGNIWLASTNGLIQHHEKSNRFTLHRFKKNTPAESSSSYVVSLFIDNNTIWAGTTNGLFKFSPLTGKTLHYTKAHGLSNNIITAIQMDKKNHLWLSTNNGLNKFYPENENFEHYYKEHGIVDNEFDINASFFSSDGRMFFGGPKGLTVFYPEKIPSKKSMPSAVISEFLILGQSPKKHSDIPQLLKKPIHLQHSISLPYTYNDFSFTLTTIDYVSPKRNLYAYKLEGYHEKWIVTNAENRKIAFTGLPAYRYRLHYKTRHIDGQWTNGKTLNIHIIPPWWKTNVAYGSYIFLLCGLVFLLIHLRTRILKKRTAILEQLIFNRTHELNQEKLTVETLLSEKNRLFSHISHELRTPLTLILGPIKTILALPPKSDILNNSSIIQRNAYRLLRLVNQLLELSRLQYKSSANKKSSNQCINISQLTKTIADAFHNLAIQKNIDFACQIPSDLGIKCSKDSYEKILLNLLSNAFKYTPKGGKITLSLHCLPQTHLTIIELSDTGIGIPHHLHNKIFEQFFQIHSSFNEQIHGSGIGLSLVKELLNEVGGNISLISEPDKGSTFTVHLPGKQVPQQPGQETSEVDFIQSVSDDKSDLALEQHYLCDEYEQKIKRLTPIIEQQYQLLIIEDNSELCQYLYGSFEKHYHCLIANDGQQGLTLAQHELPDIILCDIMMPKMNGYDLCRKLKNNDKTCHIPIILLTALNDQEYKLQGLKAQADDYLAKPFDIDELSLRLENLIIMRERLKTYCKIHQQHDENESEAPKTFIQHSPFANPKNKHFIDQLEAILEKYFHDPMLTIDTIANKLNLTKKQLHRKTTATIGESPGSLLRSYRMFKARSLLKNGKNVTEAAFDVGYSHANNFSSAFKAFFNITPKQYQEQLTKPILKKYNKTQISID